MSKSTSTLAALLLACAAGFASAQAVQGSSPGSPSTQAGSMRQVPDDPAPGQQQGGIQGQSIFDVKPEVRRDAPADPGYMEQNNGQRNAVQPGNNAPMWRGVQKGVEGYSSLPKREAPEAGVLIQGPVQYPGSRMTTAGEAWRQVRNNWIVPYGGALILISVLALAIAHLVRGPLGHNPAVGGGGRRIERFTPFERAAHWSNAIAFCVLGISGIVMAFGKFFLLPVLGLQLHGWLSYVLKNLHNFFGPLFAVSLVIIIVTFIKDEFPRKGDLGWLLGLPKLLLKKDEHDEPPTHRFNTGEKIVFWLGAFVLGIVVVASGLVLDKLLPNLLYVRDTMQVAHMVHATAAILMICITGLHIYLGTIGVNGAYRAMRDGYVDEAWAQEHHRYWYEDIQAGRIPAQRSGQALPPAETVRTA